MGKLLLAALALLIAVPAWAVDPPKTEDQKTLYAVGLLMARQLEVLSITPAEVEYVKQGLTDAVSGKTPAVDLKSQMNSVQQFAAARQQAHADKLAAETKQFVDKAAKEKGAVKTPSGLIYQSLREGTGASPTATDRVKVNYRGTLVDGKEFDSSYATGQPVEFELNKVIKCWTEGVQMMKPGGKARLICPPDIGYGERGAGMIPPNSTLVFDVELLSVEKPATK